MDNYTVEVDPKDPLGYRQLKPAPTFDVDEATGEIERVRTPPSPPEFPEIRLRFTPARGYVYGSRLKTSRKDDAPDENLRDVVYDGRKGRWPGYVDPGDETSTTPFAIFANRTDANDNAVSLGYLDD